MKKKPNCTSLKVPLCTSVVSAGVTPSHTAPPFGGVRQVLALLCWTFKCFSLVMSKWWWVSESLLRPGRSSVQHDALSLLCDCENEHWGYLGVESRCFLCLKFVNLNKNWWKCGNEWVVLWQHLPVSSGFRSRTRSRRRGAQRGGFISFWRKCRGGNWHSVAARRTGPEETGHHLPVVTEREPVALKHRFFFVVRYPVFLNLFLSQNLPPPFHLNHPSHIYLSLVWR